jgi:hypothetical protein
MKLKSLLNEFSHDGMSDRSPMTQEQSMMFMNLTMMDMNDIIPEEMQRLVNESPICRIADASMKGAGVSATVTVMLWMSVISNGSPGNAVLWAYTLCHIAEKEGDKTVTWDHLVRHFPTGFPTETTLRKCWDGQKRRADFAKGLSDNKMDSPEYWELGAELEEVPA